MGRITDALKKIKDERLERVQKKPGIEYVVRKVENTKIDEHVVSFHDASSPVGEQYKIIRTNLQALAHTKNYKVFCLTSSISGEGKSITAINLAISMAHDLDGKSILLVDADIRKGKLSHYLGINQSPGLSDILKGTAEPDSTFVSPDISNLTVIPAGKTPRNPSELLGSKNMQALVASFKARFDYVIIDTPPIMPLTDACILGPIVDGVILVIQAGRAQRNIVQHAESRLNQAHAKVLGYVMTNVEYHLPHYLYRYVHKYDSYYSHEYEAVKG